MIASHCLRARTSSWWIKLAWWTSSSLRACTVGREAPAGRAVPPPPAIVIGPRPLSSVGRSALRFVTLGSEPRSIRAWRALFGRGAPPGTLPRKPAHLQSRLYRPHLAGRPGPLRPLRPQLWRTSRPRFCPSCDGWASSCRSTRTGPTRTGTRSKLDGLRAASSSLHQLATLPLPPSRERLGRVRVRFSFSCCFVCCVSVYQSAAASPLPPA